MINRRHFFQAGAAALAGASLSTCQRPSPTQQGAQRLSLTQLQKWEQLRYGMFIHFGMSTFLRQELPDGQAPSLLYAPDALDVDQWIAVARDAGMRYAILTTKHVAGHCLWPTKHTDYNVTTSLNTTDVVEAFVRACERRGVEPGFYYCSWDNHNRFGSETPSDGGDWNGQNSFPRSQEGVMPPHTTSLYQNFQTAQIEELLKNYGPILEMWIDIPGVLGRGYREFIYNHIAKLQTDIVIMMNSGIGDGTQYDVEYAWPSDLIAIERNRPPEPKHDPWRTIEGELYYLPAEHCDPIGKEWFHVSGDLPRSDAALAEQYQQCRDRGVNFLLDVPPNTHGLIPQEYIDALKRLRVNVGI
ncbi:alpha-L-fucosidase [candidate division KSB1 bacterium]|nr:alpha-L-fucosidase [candidate division KSB1 bacterium]